MNRRKHMGVKQSVQWQSNQNKIFVSTVRKAIRDGMKTFTELQTIIFDTVASIVTFLGPI